MREKETRVKHVRGTKQEGRKGEEGHKSEGWERKETRGKDV